MVSSREQYRQSQKDQNARFKEEKLAAMSELSSGLFALIEAALQDNAPLLLMSLKEKCKQSDPYDMLGDGKAAWEHLVAMGGVDAMLPGEDTLYEAELTALALKPLPAGATHDEFAQRVNHALKNIMPYITRSYSPYQLGLWVTRQTPSDQYQEALKRFNALTKEQQKDPHGVAAMIVKMMSENRNPLDLIKGTKLGEIVATLSDEGVFVGTDTPPTGRRPPGMGKGKGRGSGGGGRGAGRGGRGEASSTTTGPGSDRATACSVTAPRGPMCDKAHRGPCWRDPANAGPLPWRIWNDPTAMKAIRADRIANGQRLGEQVVELTPAAKPTSEVVAVLDDDDLQQWPTNLDYDEDVPSEVIAVVDDVIGSSVASVAPATGGAVAAPSVAPSSEPTITDAQRLRAATNRAAALQTLHQTQLAQVQAQASAVESGLRAELQHLQSRVDAVQDSSALEVANERRAPEGRANAPDASEPLVVPMGAPVESPTVTLAYWPAREAIGALTPDSPLHEIRRVVAEAGLRVPTNVGGNSPSRTPGQHRNRRDILIEARRELNIDTHEGWGLPSPSPAAAPPLVRARPDPPSDLVRAVYTLRVIGSGGDVPKLDKISSSSLSAARRTLRDHSAEFADMSPGQLKCAAWVMLYASPPRDAAAVRYVADMPQRRHALGLVRLRLLQLAEASDGPRDFGNYEVFVTSLGDVSRAYHAAVVEALQLYEDNGGDHADADHSELLLSDVIPAEVAFLAPLWPAPGSPEGIALDISERLHAAAAPYARVALWALVAIAIASLHASCEAVWGVLLLLWAHACAFVAGGHGGDDDYDDYDFNVSLYRMATNPPNILQQAAQGNVLASGVMASFAMLLAYNRRALAGATRRLWRFITRTTSETTVLIVLLVFV